MNPPVLGACCTERPPPPESKPLLKVQRLSWRKNLVYCTASQYTASICSKFAESRKEDTRLNRLGQREWWCSTFFYSLSVLPRDTVAICWITVLHRRLAGSGNKTLTFWVYFFICCLRHQHIIHVRILSSICGERWVLSIWVRCNIVTN